MIDREDVAVTDFVADAIAATAVSERLEMPQTAVEAAKNVLFDSIAVAVAALPHRASIIAREYEKRFATRGGPCAIWGSRRKGDIQTASLVNGVLMRCHDFNDLYVGKCSGGHPSDILVGLIAAAERCKSPGRDLLAAAGVSYEVMLALFDALPVESRGFDYTNVTLIGATCGIGRLMRLTAEQMKQALCISATSHLATNEIESGDLNARGDLTLWKRFHGAEAVRQACLACELASVGVEGALRAFTGSAGFITLMGGAAAAVDELRGAFRPGMEMKAICGTTMKRWPVGSRAQSAVNAALKARRKIGGPQEIASVRIIANEAAYEHLVRIRPHAWTPFSRETADHSLPYAVGAALLDGRVGPDSFDAQVVTQPDRLEFLKKISVEIDPAGGSRKEQADQGYPSSVALRTVDDREILEAGGCPPGHLRNRFTKADLEEKLKEGLAASGWEDRAPALSKILWSIETCDDVSALTAQFAADDE